jgi:phosphoglycolate phosphatase-like HAD superfamily hydrolase
LFDIDGTLLTADGAGRRALSLAMRDVCGRGDAIDGIDFRGMTDTLIIEQALLATSESAAQCSVDEILSAYVKHLEQQLTGLQSARALPGVVSLLDALHARGGPLAIGLGTGNIKEAAYMKLGKVGLSGYFSFGGFGSDHRIRSELIRTGAVRGSQQLCCKLSDCQVIVIGDTFHDVDAALAIGARALGVGTSGKSRQELLSRGASYAFETLEDPAVIDALIG